MRRVRASAPVSRAWTAGSGPARGGCVVMVAGFYPALAFLALLALPERRAGLEIVHQEFRRLEGRLPVRRRGHHQHDVFARSDAAEAVDDGQALQRPA